MSQIIADNFNRADAADLGSEWTNVNTSNEQLRVNTNQCNMAVGAGTGAAYYSGAGWTGGADQYSEAKIIALQSAKDMAPMCRASGTTTANYFGYLFDVNENDAAVALGNSISCAIYKKKNGGTGDYTVMGATFSVTINANDVIRIEAQGTTIRAVVNGTVVATRTDSDIATGKPGLYIGSGNGSTWDDWAAGDFGAGDLSALVGEPVTGSSILN